MPAVQSPFGLKPKHSPSGIIRPQRYVVPLTDMANWPTNIYQDDAVYIDVNGRLGVSSTSNTACVGSFQGVEYNDSTGRRTVSNQFVRGAIPNSQTANAGLGTNDVWFWIYTDPNLVFEIQLSAPLTQIGSPSAMGSLISYNQGTGQNAVVGFSTGFGSVSSSQAANGGSFIVYNLAYDNQPQNTYAPGTPTGINTNNWSDAYPNVLVRLANAQFNGSLPAF